VFGSITALIVWEPSRGTYGSPYDPLPSMGTYGSPYDPLPFLYGLLYGLLYGFFVEGFVIPCHKGILMGYHYRVAKKILCISFFSGYILNTSLGPCFGWVFIMFFGEPYKMVIIS